MTVRKTRETVFKEVISWWESVGHTSGEWWIYQCGTPHRDPDIHLHGDIVGFAVFETTQTVLPGGSDPRRGEPGWDVPRVVGEEPMTPLAEVEA